MIVDLSAIPWSVRVYESKRVAAKRLPIGIWNIFPSTKG